MTVKFVNGVDIARPKTTPLKSSLLDHVEAAGNFVTETSFGMNSTLGVFNSFNGLDLLTPTLICPDPLAKTVKTFAFASWQPGFEFALYGGVQCSNLGLDIPDAKAETKRVFDWSQGKGIEKTLLSTRFVANAGTADMHGVTVGWAAPVVLTNTAATGLNSAYVALALLEGYAAANYVGVPTIHMPRALATILEVSGLIKWEGDLAFTQNGSKVAMGGGYDVSEADGTWDVYATGEVLVEASEEIFAQEHTLPGYVAAHASEPNSNLTDNSTVILAERMYRVTVDSFVAKTTATIW